MSSAQTSDTKMRTRRIAFPKRVAIRPRDGIAVNQGQIFDLSQGGMFVSTFQPLDVGEMIDFEMEIAHMRFSGAGRVVWTRSSSDGDAHPIGVAIEFVNLTPGQKRLLNLEIKDYLMSGGKAKIGRPPKPGVAVRSPTARKGGTPPAPRSGLFRRFTSMLGF